jgi:hypothetical protein
MWCRSAARVDHGVRRRRVRGYHAGMGNVMAVLAALLVVGCKSDKPPDKAPVGSASAAGEAKPACALLTATEISKVVGNGIKDGVVDGTFFCKYLEIDPPGYDPASGKPPPPQFSAHTLYAHGDRQFDCDHVLPAKPGNPAGTVAPVAGLGDRAAWELNPTGWDGSLTVCRGADVIQVTLTCTQCKSTENHLPQLETLAKLMLGRL